SDDRPRRGAIRSGRKFDRCDHEGIHPRASSEPRGVDSTNRYTATSVAGEGHMTQPERFQFESTDGLSIACVKWVRPQKVRGVIQIAHGLGEHMGRYAQLAEILLEDEFAVYGNDHRGHGLTAKPSGSFGEFGPGGFDQLVEDMISLRVVAKNEHPGKPYILLGHSLGSSAAQQFVLDHSHSIGGLAHSRAWLIRKKSGKCEKIFPDTFSQEATIKLGKDWKECVC